MRFVPVAVGIGGVTSYFLWRKLAKPQPWIARVKGSPEWIRADLGGAYFTVLVSEEASALPPRNSIPIVDGETALDRPGMVATLKIYEEGYYDPRMECVRYSRVSKHRDLSINEATALIRQLDEKRGDTSSNIRRRARLAWSQLVDFIRAPSTTLFWYLVQ